MLPEENTTPVHFKSQNGCESELSEDIHVGDAEVLQLPDEVDRNDSVWERVKEFGRSNKMKIALGVAATSTVLTIANGSYNEVIENASEAFPMVAGGIVASECAFVGGACMMAASIGTKVGNPFTVKDRLDELAVYANDSVLFKSGFAVNATGAIGSAATVTAGVLMMPVETYPVLALTLTDIGATLAVRKAVYSSLKRKTDDSTIDVS